MTYTIAIEYDQDADFSWLDQPEFADENPADHIALNLALFDDNGKVIDSLCGIDFLEASNDWITGTFDSVDEIPAQCGYLREIADAMIEAHVRIEADRYLSLL